MYCYNQKKKGGDIINKIIEENIQILETKFNHIKDMGWVKSKFRGCGAVGQTFEHLLGKDVENSEAPDFMGIEIKTHKETGTYPITLFRATPIGEEEYQIKYLAENFGNQNETFSNRKNLGGTVTSQRKTKFGNHFYFQLKVEEDKQLLRLLVFDENDNLIYDDAYWDFDVLEEKLKRKLGILCYIKADRKFEHNTVYFKYKNIEFFYLKDFKHFIHLLEKGIITVNFCVYAYKNGDKKGEIHDHGTCFRIFPNQLNKLFYPYCQDKDNDIRPIFLPFYI